MAGSSAAEVAYTPVMNPEVVTDENKSGLRRFNLLQLVLCIILLVIVVFQFIAIVTPGWNISYTDSVSGYESVYYSTLCIDDECKTTSFRDAFYTSYRSASDQRKPSLAREYNILVLNQLNVQITWFLIIATLVFQVYKLIKNQEAFPRATAVNIVVLACACPLMFQVLFKTFVQVDYTRKITDTVDINVGFPYSFFLYALTFAAVIGSLVLIVKQVLDQLREKDRMQAELKVKFDRLKLEYDAEVDAFKRYRQRHHLRPESGGSYRRDRRSTGDDRAGSHSPRHSREIRDHDRDHRRHDDHSPRRPDGRHSPRPRDRSPPGMNSHGNHSPRPQNRSRSPARYDPGNHSPRPQNRSESPLPYGHGRHSPRNHSPRSEELRTRRHSPTRNNSSNSEVPDHYKNLSPMNLGDHDNPALVVTPPSDTMPMINTDPPATHDPETNVTVRETTDAKTEDIELSVSKREGNEVLSV